jgi:arabinose-5-phosphate isomerase
MQKREARCLQSAHRNGRSPHTVPTSTAKPPIFNTERAYQLACATFDTEASGLQGLKARLGASFGQAVQTILRCPGRVVVMGMGKSGHVGRKIAATLASTGTPAMFVHPAEASHGDLGMVTASDVVLAISNSGQSEELARLVPALKRLQVPLLLMTGKLQSMLAELSGIVLDTGVDHEACPLNLAPTASTTAQMAMGDALAVVLLDARGFKAEDFARSHPGGSLGRKLLTHVHDVMRSGADIPQVLPEATLIDVMREMTRKGLGATAVTSSEGEVLGIFTDGDLRRLIETGQGETGQDIRTLTAQTIMHPQPRLVPSSALAVDAASLMEQHGISSVLVVDSARRLVGVLGTHDLMRAKVI